MYSSSAEYCKWDPFLRDQIWCKYMVIVEGFPLVWVYQFIIVFFVIQGMPGYPTLSVWGIQLYRSFKACPGHARYFGVRRDNRLVSTARFPPPPMSENSGVMSQWEFGHKSLIAVDFVMFFFCSGDSSNKFLGKRTCELLFGVFFLCLLHPPKGVHNLHIRSASFFFLEGMALRGKLRQQPPPPSAGDVTETVVGRWSFFYIPWGSIDPYCWWKKS